MKIATGEEKKEFDGRDGRDPAAQTMGRKGAQQERRYSPGECCGTRKDVIEGEPEKKDISTSYVERSNL